VDVLTDTTERSPTYCTPPFRKWDDERASDSWAFLFTPEQTTELAWPALLGRRPQTIEWTGAELGGLLDDQAAARQAAVLDEIRLRELMRFRIGLDGVRHRPARKGDGLTAVVSEQDAGLLAPGGAFAAQLARARAAGAWTAVVGIGRAPWITALEQGASRPDVDHLVTVRLPGEAGLLDPLLRISAKMLLNSLSTCTMVRLGRVLGNRMIWVVPSNLKLIDRATRYVRDLASVPYDTACRTLFDVIEYVEPRRQAGQAYPAPVGVAVMRLRHGLGLREAEARLIEELQAG
jgi:N-acetylmuramic acid 6-phosphate etherase